MNRKVLASQAKLIFSILHLFNPTVTTDIPEGASTASQPEGHLASPEAITEAHQRKCCHDRGCRSLPGATAVGLSAGDRPARQNGSRLVLHLVDAIDRSAKLDISSQRLSDCRRFVG